MNEKKAKIENFIGIYDNYILKDECDKAIKLYENEVKLHGTLNRLQFEGSSVLEKKDNFKFINGENIDLWWEDLKTTMLNFNIAWNHYLQNTGAKEAYGGIPFHFTTLKIQKTLPTQGYHLWHVEHNKGFDNEPRAFVFSIYLNDVEEGGETEFLNFSRRVKPKAGRIVIWPAGFPYVHRGNPPLAGEKYILTSWMRLR
jgi:hypothetical protein